MKLNQGLPYWLIKNGLPYNYPKLEQSLKTDIVIIGGGISGALSAYYLVKAGFQCTMVDGRTVGLGSTCASTALLQYELDAPLCELIPKIGKEQAERAYTLCGAAIDVLERIAKNIGYKGYKKHSSVYYAANKKDHAFIQNEYKARKEAGFEVTLLESAALFEQYGFKAPAAIVSEQGACIDTYKFTHALHQYNIKKGLQIFDRTKVTDISYQKNGVALTTENGCSIKAKYIVNATGFEVTDFIDKNIVKLYSTYAIASEHLPDDVLLWKDNSMIWNTADPYLYMRTTDDKRIIAGGRDERFTSSVRSESMINVKSAQLVKDFKKLFPDIDFKAEFKWCGVFGSTKDSLPFIGTYKPHPHTYYALGFGGNGITFSVIAAKIIADELSGKHNKDAVLFSFNRI